MKLNTLTVAIGAASVMMLGLSQAQAFDRSHWNWDLDVQTIITEHITINDHFNNPGGITLVEIDQDFNGSLTAVSTVTDIDNSDWGLGELGAIESAATAVANNASLSSEVMPNIDANQFWQGSGTIDASSYVANINNMTVDSVATAVANNLSVDFDAAGHFDSVLLANVVQTGVGDISAYSTVDNVTLSVAAPESFTGPHISSVATAVGNNVSVNVGGNL
ncbi:hypothetical protein ELY33_02880 [Vreelandella andesensis]|uniref:Adhesin n=1 Tax=Vreelandella andesensis TaxID=447567 RepID=A0A433KUY4_9GAMM|nr:hypothetical protein [Halomonas andesensis]RUR33320.1 hypothetical protein ELY33_02880 [Halomonas andesensis]